MEAACTKNVNHKKIVSRLILPELPELKRPCGWLTDSSLLEPVCICDARTSLLLVGGSTRFQRKVTLLAQLTDMINAFYGSLLCLAKTNRSRRMHLHFIAGTPFPMACLRDIAHVLQMASIYLKRTFALFATGTKRQLLASFSQASPFNRHVAASARLHYFPKARNQFDEQISQGTVAPLYSQEGECRCMALGGV